MGIKEPAKRAHSRRTAVRQAIEDALDLKRRGVELLEIPLSPSRLFELTRNAQS